eukprot:GEMP01057855.1.p1 GENE.GEMP01057855.1~~GEMP01057855.1.p1  ORF type:complete len:208 (-),score=30.55 GEMP01057855.1:761-1384(-)
MENCSILNDESKGRMLAAPQQYGMTAERKGAADDFGNRMVIRQEIRGTDAVVEMCGCDVKNRYAVEAGIRQYYISEESNCFERFLCKCQRSLTFRLHDGPTADHPILYHFEKPCHCQIVCCGSLRPTIKLRAHFLFLTALVFFVVDALFVLSGGSPYDTFFVPRHVHHQHYRLSPLTSENYLKILRVRVFSDLYGFFDESVYFPRVR